MALIVQKYGGTSVGDIDKIRAVAEKVSTIVKAVSYTHLTLPTKA